MSDPELEAITAIANALEELTADQRHNVLLYITARYGGVPTKANGSALAPADTAHGTGDFLTIGDLFDAANPRTESERALVAAYWLQVIGQADGFEAYPVSKHLRELGRPVSNITRALDSMGKQSTRLVLQTGKAGSARQARKRYRVTREGIKRVQGMLKRTEEGDGGN